MEQLLARLLGAVSKAALDPALGGRGLALSRVFSLAAHAVSRTDESALRAMSQLVGTLERVLGEARHLRHEEWNELQALAESAHWFLRTEFPQINGTGAVSGGYVAVAGIQNAVDSSTLGPADLVINNGASALKPAPSVETPRTTPTPPPADASSPPTPAGGSSSRRIPSWPS